MTQKYLYWGVKKNSATLYLMVNPLHVGGVRKVFEFGYYVLDGESTHR